MIPFSRATRLITNMSTWRTYQRSRLQNQYLERVVKYGRQEIREPDIVKQVRQRLAARGWQPRQQSVGEIHTFALIPTIGWHSTLIETLGELGRVTLYPFEGARCFWRHGRRRNWTEIRSDTNEDLFQSLSEAHRACPVDWVFGYTEGLHLLRDTVRRIREELGVPTVMMCLDDKQSWQGEKVGGQWSGQVDLVPEFDLYWTSARACRNWIAAEGGRPVYLPEGCDPGYFRPVDIEKDIEVSFVGRAYGFRKDLIAFLKRWHVPVRVFGAEWGGDAPLLGDRELVRVFNRSKINLGHGGIGYSEGLTNVKARDFEAPATGGGMYLTTFSSDLALHFAIGREIACYHGREELVDLIYYYLDRPELREEMARSARKRCVNEHRWIHRYIRLLQMLGVVDKGAVSPPLSSCGLQ